jgi:nucleotide-binding universal stress UspA family protein
MKRILVPTDFSSTAEKAFRLAVEIAVKAKGTVILYHTYIPVESTFIGTEKTRKQYNAHAEANIVKRLQRLKKKVTGDVIDVAVSTIVGRSPLIDNILGFAEHNHIDLIVMGTQGASGLKKTIIGTVAARVIENSDLPVLLVPSRYELEEVKQIMFATNFRASDKKALTLVDAIAKLYNADITVLHFLSVYNNESEKEKERNDFDNYAFSLGRIFNESKIKFHLQATASVIETMEKLDKEFPYNIMAMVRRKKTYLEKFFIKSFTQNMAYLTTKPLLIVPEEE